MKKIAKKILDFQESIREFARKTIDYLAKDEIKKAERQYELMYDKRLNDQEKLEIKKGVLIHYSKYMIAVLFIILVVLIAI